MEGETPVDDASPSAARGTYNTFVNNLKPADGPGSYRLSDNGASAREHERSQHHRKRSSQRRGGTRGRNHSPRRWRYRGGRQKGWKYPELRRAQVHLVRKRGACAECRRKKTACKHALATTNPVGDMSADAAPEAKPSLLPLPLLPDFRDLVSPINSVCPPEWNNPSPEGVQNPDIPNDPTPDISIEATTDGFYNVEGAINSASRVNELAGVLQDLESVVNGSPESNGTLTNNILSTTVATGAGMVRLDNDIQMKNFFPGVNPTWRINDGLNVPSSRGGLRRGTRINCTASHRRARSERSRSISGISFRPLVPRPQSLLEFPIETEQYRSRVSVPIMVDQRPAPQPGPFQQTRMDFPLGSSLAFGSQQMMDFNPGFSPNQQFLSLWQGFGNNKDTYNVDFAAELHRDPFAFMPHNHEDGIMYNLATSSEVHVQNFAAGSNYDLTVPIHEPPSLTYGLRSDSSEVNRGISSQLSNISHDIAYQKLDIDKDFMSLLISNIQPHDEFK